MTHNPGVNESTGLYSPPYSFEITNINQKGGILAVAVIGFVSAVAVIGPLWNLTFSVFRRKHMRNRQCLTLIYCLMLADLIQALGFVFEFHWIHVGRILAPTSLCSVQGAFINLGDVANAFFVLAIAIWTAWQLMVGRNIPQIVFRLTVGSIWLAALILTIVGPSSHGQSFFTAAGSWCWISPDFEPERLAFHYVWIFIVEFLTFLIYGGLGVVLYQYRFDVRAHGQDPKKIKRVVSYMFCYWAIYTFCTLPIAAGRMHSYADGYVSPTTFAILGCFLASCGWVDALLYNLTRWQDLLEDEMTEEEKLIQPHEPSSTVLSRIASEPKLQRLL